ncbi:hypothetical protein ABPG74_004687 [Tetrahymena malaccensis]
MQMRSFVLSLMDFSFIRQIQYNNSNTQQKTCHIWIDLTIALIIRILFPLNLQNIMENQYLYNIIQIPMLFLDQIVLKCLFKIIFQAKYSFLLSYVILNIYLYLLNQDQYNLNYYYFHLQLYICFIYQMIPSILNCSYQNDLIVAEIHQYYIDSYQIILGLFESFLISYFHTTTFSLLNEQIKVFYLFVILCNLICFSSIILARLEKHDSDTTKDRIIMFITMAILNPPWINIDIFIDKAQSICYEISNWHLFYKFMQISTITFSLALTFDLSNISLIFILLLGITLTFNYIKQISRHLSRNNKSNFDRLKQYYQLSYRNREGDVIENQLCYSWMQETKLLQNNLNLQQLIGSQIEYLFHTFFKPGILEENQKNMFKSNQTLFLCIENKMKLQYFSADRLLAFTLFCIYKFMRFSNETSLRQLPDINKPDQVNAYFEKFQSFQNKIFGNQNIKEITLQNQIDFSKSIFIYKFFERMLELPLVKIVIFFDHQKNLYNHSINRYRDFLQQFVTQIVFKRFDYQFKFNYKILLYDFYEDDFFQSKLNKQSKSNQNLNIAEVK